MNINFVQWANIWGRNIKGRTHKMLYNADKRHILKETSKFTQNTEAKIRQNTIVKASLTPIQDGWYIIQQSKALYIFFILLLRQFISSIPYHRHHCISPYFRDRPIPAYLSNSYLLTTYAYSGYYVYSRPHYNVL